MEPRWTLLRGFADAKHLRMMTERVDMQEGPETVRVRRRPYVPVRAKVCGARSIITGVPPPSS